jgi:UDP-2,3-diacylglucosamine pyrophosphatase LpxH
MKYKTIIVSDLHLGIKDSKCDEFIKFIETHKPRTLILNGDIIDGWALNRGSKWRKRHMKVLTKLLKLSKDIDIILIRGNHDDFLKEYIDMDFGNIKIRENYKIKIAGTKYFVFHGDIIDIFITKVKWLSILGSIGYDFLLWLNRTVNYTREFFGLPYYSLSKKIKDNVKLATNYINDFDVNAIKLAKLNGCGGAICGHIHNPCERIIDDTYHYINSGDWVENMSAILVDFDDNISIYRYK